MGEQKQDADTVLAAYPLSVKDFGGRKVFTSLFIFVMIFTASLILLYPLVQKHFVKGVMIGSVKG